MNTVPDYLNVTDGRTDGQTDRRLTVASPRSALASHGKREEKSRKIQSRYISRISREAPREPIPAQFCMSREMADIITCANFGFDKLSG